MAESYDERPNFSIIIPTYNRRLLTLRATESALMCRSCGLEVLVVDDASDDDTARAVRARYADDARVHVLRLPTNRGPSAARNLGVQHAVGRLFLFLDSDDILLPEALAYAQAAFDTAPEISFLALAGNAMLVHSGEQVDDIQRKWNPGWAKVEDWPARSLMIPTPPGCEARPATLQVGDLSKAILFNDLFFLSGTVVRRDAVLAAGTFCERFRLFEDWDFMIRVCRAGLGGYLDHTGFLREHGRDDQLSAAATLVRRAVMHQRVLERVRAAGRAESDGSRRALRRAQAIADYLLARALLQQRRYRRSRHRFARALAGGHKPLKSLAWLVGTVFVPGIVRQRLDQEHAS